MTASSSRLDLTGQASEDEPASHASHQSQHQQHQQPEQIRQQNRKQESQSQLTAASQGARCTTNSLDTRNDRNQSSNNNEDNNNTSNPPPGVVGGILTRLPSPIDLWQTRTFPSLFLLPIVFIIYVILQLPLHHNSTAETNHWRGRAKEVDQLSTELNHVGKELDHVKDDQKEIKGMVTSLRRRLGKMKQRRDVREELMKARERDRMERERRREEEELRKQEQQQQPGLGMGRDGPITTVTMAKALAVSTFAGKSNNDADDNFLARKKDD